MDKELYFSNNECLQVLNAMDDTFKINCAICGACNRWEKEESDIENAFHLECASCGRMLARSILALVWDKDADPTVKMEDPMIVSRGSDLEDKFTQLDPHIGCNSICTGDKNKLDTGRMMAGVLEDFLPALNEVAKLGSMNNKPNGKYDRGSWMLVENADQRYNDAFWRHQLAGRHNIDEETGMPHDVAIAWNALALLWFRLKREGKI